MSSKRVLIVDDEEDTLKLLKIIVELSGYEAYITLNSLEALTMAQVEQPDVVLLDVMMPKLDGFQLCKMMRANPKTRDLPVIFVTAYDALDLEQRRLESGGDMVLSKPVGMDTLSDAIEKVQTIARRVPDDIQKASADITLAKSPFKSNPELLTAALAARETSIPVPAPAKQEVQEKPAEVTEEKPAEAAVEEKPKETNS
jgi:CheY-like chemotaxis protein